MTAASAAANRHPIVTGAAQPEETAKSQCHQHADRGDAERHCAAQVIRPSRLLAGARDQYHDRPESGRHQQRAGDEDEPPGGVLGEDAARREASQRAEAEGTGGPGDGAFGLPGIQQPPGQGE
jgi:hypothetical protein